MLLARLERLEIPANSGGPLEDRRFILWCDHTPDDHSKLPFKAENFSSKLPADKLAQMALVRRVSLALILFPAEKLPLTRKLLGKFLIGNYNLP